MSFTNPVPALPGDTTLPSNAADLEALIAYETGDYAYSVEDFFRNPDKSYYQLSPDGQYFAFLAPYERRRNLFVQKIGDSTAQRISAETDRDIAGYLWASNERLLYLKDSGGDENFQLYAVNRDGSEAKDLTPFEGVKIQFIDELPQEDDAVIIGMNKNNPQLFEPYRINIRSGELQQLAANDDPANPIVGWATDHEGRLRLAYRVRDGVKVSLLWRPDEQAPWQESITTDWKESLDPLFFDFEHPDRIYAASNLGRDKVAIVSFNLRSGQEERLIFAHPDVDVEGLSYSRRRRVPTTISYTTDKRQLHILDAEVAALYARLKAAFGDDEVLISSTNRAEDRFIVRTYSDRSLGAHYFFDKNSGDIQKIAELSPWLDAAQMQPMQPVRYQARDGLTIHGYLTLPGGGQRPYPLIVLPHGGPSARDTWGYRPDVQLLASRGYAVLQMNFRGSTGYGRAFWTAGFKRWGAEMQHDITDGVDWLVREGLADPARVGIYGGSYGGYAVLAGLTYTPELYACGVDYVGVSNIFTILENIPPYWEPYRQMMYEQIGDPNIPADHAHMRAYSPALNAERIKAPLLVVQGANDPRVKIGESDQIVRALRGRGVDVPYMVRYDEGHGFQNEENRFAFYKVMLGFLAKHLKG